MVRRYNGIGSFAQVLLCAAFVIAGINVWMSFRNNDDGQSKPLVRGGGTASGVEIAIPQLPLPFEGIVVDIIVTVTAGNARHLSTCLQRIRQFSNGIQHRVILADARGGGGGMDSATTPLPIAGELMGHEIHVRPQGGGGGAATTNRSLMFQEAVATSLRMRPASGAVVFLEPHVWVTPGFLQKLVAALAASQTTNSTSSSSSAATRCSVVGPLSNSLALASMPSLDGSQPFVPMSWNVAWRRSRDSNSKHKLFEAMGSLVSQSSALSRPALPYLAEGCILLSRDLVEAVPIDMWSLPDLPSSTTCVGYGEYISRLAREHQCSILVDDATFVWNAVASLTTVASCFQLELSENAKNAVSSKSGQELHLQSLQGVRAAFADSTTVCNPDSLLVVPPTPPRTDTLLYYGASGNNLSLVPLLPTGSCIHSVCVSRRAASH